MPEKSWFFATEENDQMEEKSEFVRAKRTSVIISKKGESVNSLYDCHGWEYGTATSENTGNDGTTLEAYDNTTEDRK
ncbi:hypothetical protein [Methanolobus halotolerans]|uniref:Uncharacterized protein n=1 Tax=Methanolobus halotolerans TaxID=2052935 RepID=A0A4E0Q695_9EURY|nr:hypothetical protein [Methanolobus halotolerans]TGC09757.1 hypothetical protein CUN85_05190 [Methanolobus halotolerans]